MMKWIGAFLLATGVALGLASGCGNPEIASICNPGDVSCQDASVNTTAGAAGMAGSFNMSGTGGGNPSCPHKCADLNADCGSVVDTACGNVVVDCPNTTCPNAGEECGCGGPSKCGVCGTDGGTDGGTCVASTCAELGAECGFVNDTKCPGTTVDCTGVKTCAAGEFCMSGKCTAGDGGSCVETVTSCDPTFECGQVATNCGAPLNCGSGCPTAKPDCVDHKCTTSGSCVQDPAFTCAGRGYTCGATADNCGNKLDCGPTDCGGKPGWSCGGGGTPGTCGCVGTCSKIPDCATGTTTTLTGKVYDPAGNNPLYNVLVYVPNDPTDPNLKTFPAQISCDVCGASAAGSPLVSAFTAVDGSFTLTNVPVGTGIPVVIQLGRWRRQFSIDITKSCQPNAVANKTLLMPSTQAQGNIPLMAMMTGDADSLECVLRKMGIASTEFTNPAQNGRVQFYLGAGNSGQSIDANTPGQATLFSNSTINKYDIAVLACQGAAYAETAADQTTLRGYAAKGGRIFTSHYSYTWLYQNDTTAGATAGTVDNWSEVAKWHRDGNDQPATVDGIIDKVSNPKGNAFQGWLEAVGASVPMSGIAKVIVIRHDTDLISTKPGQTQQWLYRAGTSFKTCAISGDSCTTDTDCPKRCSLRTGTTCMADTDCTAKVCQGRTSMGCMVDGDCGSRGPCVANTCSSTVNGCSGGNDYTGTEVPLHFTYNTPVNLVQDLTKTPPAVQCGRVLFSDFHVSDAAEHNKIYPAQCGFGVARARPATPTCTTNKCSGTGVACTTAADCPKAPTCTTNKCSNTGAACINGTDCANACTADNDCMGTCSGGLCPWGSACSTNADCASKCSPDGRCLDPMNAQEKTLEFMIFDLGSCVPPPKTCTPTPCPAGMCGFTQDGCGGLSQCDPCPAGTACGVGTPAVANKCGSVVCTPLKDCTNAGPNMTTPTCGYVSDGCSGVVNCGMCPTGQVCVNGGCSTGICTSTTTCTSQNIQCGSAADNCGNKLDCGMCPTGQQCSMGKCYPNGCIPTSSCATQSLECGPAVDNCGAKLDCGDCPAGDFCSMGKCLKLP